MDGGAGGGLDLDGADPAFVGEAGFHEDVLVGHDTIGGDLDRLGQGIDDVGRTDLPFSRVGTGQGCEGDITRSPVSIEPGEEIGSVGGGQGAVVDEGGVGPVLGRGGEPGRHGAAFDLTPDHAGVAEDIGEVVEGEGGGAIGVMTLGAMQLEDPGDATVPGEGCVGLGGGEGIGGRCFEDATRCGGGGPGGGTAGDKGFEGVAQRMEPGFGAGIAEAVLVIDGATIDDGVGGIGDEDFGGGAEGEGGGEETVWILEDWSGPPGVGGEGAEGIGGV